MRSLFILLVLVSLSFAQMGRPDPARNYPELGNTDIYGGQGGFEQNLIPFSHFDNFYRRDVHARILISPDYTGLSGSLLSLKNRRYSMGLAMQFNQLITTNQRVRQTYRELQPGGQYYFIPILLNIKIHLNQNADLHDFAPYIIGGLGPALGLYIPSGGNFFNNLSAISNEIGAGGFAGVGVDYFWKEEWALSLDVRYHLFRFSQPFGENREYRGVTFFFGFTKAIDY
jgi:hypothetical protein